MLVRKGERQNPVSLTSEWQLGLLHVAEEHLFHHVVGDAKRQTRTQLLLLPIKRFLTNTHRSTVKYHQSVPHRGTINMSQAAHHTHCNEPLIRASVVF